MHIRKMSENNIWKRNKGTLKDNIYYYQKNLPLEKVSKIPTTSLTNCLSYETSL